MAVAATASLKRAAFDDARRAAPVVIKRAFTGIARAWQKLLRAQAVDYRAYAAMPRSLLAALEEFIASAGAYLSENSQPQANELQAFFF